MFQCKRLVHGRSRIDDSVIGGLQKLFNPLDIFPNSLVKIRFLQAFKDVIFRHLGKVDHVGIVKAVVPQFIQHNLVTGEIFNLRIRLHHLIHGQQQGGLRKIVPVSAILQVPQGDTVNTSFTSGFNRLKLQTTELSASAARSTEIN